MRIASGKYWLALFAAVALLAPALAPRAQGEGSSYSSAQLEQMVASIALYPDSLLSQVLMASTYPTEIVLADRWVRANPGLTGGALDSALAQQSWDPSVISLCQFPQVLAKMSENLDWTQDLGTAFLNQQADVMSAVQKMRDDAYRAGNLQTNTQQKVIVEQQVVQIVPVNPEVIYVPVYSPTVVYGPYWNYPTYYYPPAFWAPPPGYALVNGFFWGVGFAVGNAMFGGCDWHNHSTYINNNVVINNNIYRNTNVYKNVNVNRNVNVNKNVNGGRTEWKRDPAAPPMPARKPGQGQGVSGRPGTGSNVREPGKTPATPRPATPAAKPASATTTRPSSGTKPEVKPVTTSPGSSASKPSGGAAAGQGAKNPAVTTRPAPTATARPAPTTTAKPASTSQGGSMGQRPAGGQAGASKPAQGQAKQPGTKGGAKPVTPPAKPKPDNQNR